MSDSSTPSEDRNIDIGRPDPEDRNATAAQRLMNAVICLLIERGTELLADALKPEEVTRRAGKSRASYYRTEGFPASEATNSEARLAVLERVVAQVLGDSAADLSQVVGGIAEYIEGGWESDSPRDFVRTAAETNFDEMADYLMVMQLLAGALAPSSVAVESSLRGYYRSVTSSYAAAYEEVFRFWGYRPKPPITAEKFATVLMALAEGLMLRKIAGADVDRQLFGELISTVATVLVVAEGDVSVEAVPPEHDLPGEVVPPSRAGIIATLVRLFEGERASLPTAEELARAAGCTVQTVRSRFGGVPGVIRAAWDEWTPEFEEVAERNRRAMRSADPMTVLYRVALSVATRAVEQQALTRALLMSEIGVDPRSAIERPEAIAALFERLLVEASEEGDFRPPAVNNEAVSAGHITLFSHALRTSILNIAVSHPVPTGVTGAEHARWCVDYVWALLVPPRGARA